MSNAEYYHARYEKAKKDHKCPFCGKQDERTLSGRVLCFECAKKKHSYYMTHKEELTAEYQRSLYAMRKREHLCTRCGKQDAYTLNGRSRCFECEEKRRKKPVDYVPEKKKCASPPRQLGVWCWHCNKEKPIEGKLLCPKCYEKALANIAKAQAKRKEIRYRWHDLDFRSKYNHAAGGNIHDNPELLEGE